MSRVQRHPAVDRLKRIEEGAEDIDESLNRQRRITFRSIVVLARMMTAPPSSPLGPVLPCPAAFLEAGPQFCHGARQLLGRLKGHIKRGQQSKHREVTEVRSSWHQRA